MSMLMFNIKGRVFLWNGAKDRDALQQFLDQYALVPCSVDVDGEWATITGGNLGNDASGFVVTHDQVSPGGYIGIVGASVLVLSKQQVGLLMAP